MNKTQQSLQAAMFRLGRDNQKAVDLMWVLSFVPVTFIMWYLIKCAIKLGG